MLISHSAVKYGEVARILGLSSSTVRDGVKSLILAIKNLQRELKLTACIKETGIKEDEFINELDSLAEIAINDKCTETNPRAANIEEIKALFQ